MVFLVINLPKEISGEFYFCFAIHIPLVFYVFSSFVGHIVHLHSSEWKMCIQIMQICKNLEF